MWQFRMAFMLELDTVEDVPQSFKEEGLRSLALQIYLQAVADAKDGDGEAEVWLAGPGRDLLENLGITELAALPVERLLASVNTAQLKDALGEDSRHCRDCIFLRCSGGRCRCEKGMWAEQGRADEYAESTVKHDTKGFLKPCKYWRDK